METIFSIPTVFILRQAMDVIRREALLSDIETGGILIGSRSENGSILVTHATSPGPVAVHNAVYFQRDVAYQQAELNRLHEQYGVQYLGEWHKHPRSLPVPSGGDATGVRELLADPDYGVDSILFPIVICEKDLGFQLHPFYVSRKDSSMQFHPMVWEELPLAFEPDRVFAGLSLSEQSERTATIQEGLGGYQNTERPLAANWSWRDIAKSIPFFARPGSQFSDSRCSESPDENKDSDKTLQWYETPIGREVLKTEKAHLQSFGLSANPFTIKGGALCFSFPRTGGREIVAICSSRHPDQSPEIFIRTACGEKHNPIPCSRWGVHNYLADIIVPLLGPEPPVSTRSLK
jgi:integrative and conjugative element protein (TIGR02256 family)